MKKSILLKTRKQAMSTLLLIGIAIATLPNVMAQTQESQTTFLSVDTLRMNQQLGEELNDLLYNLQPTTYINGNTKLRTFAAIAPVETPIVVECLPAFVADLYAEDESYANVRVIKMKITSANDLVNITLSRLTSFTSLEYIELIFEYPVCGSMQDVSCLETKVKEMISVGEQPITVLYQLSIPQ